MSNEFYISINGEEVPVTEEVYRAYKRPEWTEQKRRKVRAWHESSLEEFAGENFFEFPAEQASVDEAVEEKLQLEMLTSVPDKLTADERNLIKALFFEDKSERKVEAETGVPQKTLNYRKNKILKWLKKEIS